MRDSTDPERYVTLNQRFHNTLDELAGRPRLTKLIADLRDATKAYLHAYAAHDSGAFSSVRMSWACLPTRSGTRPPDGGRLCWLPGRRGSARARCCGSSKNAQASA